MSRGGLPASDVIRFASIVSSVIPLQQNKIKVTDVRMPLGSGIRNQDQECGKDDGAGEARDGRAGRWEGWVVGLDAPRCDWAMIGREMR